MVWTIVANIVIVGVASATIDMLAAETRRTALILGTYLEEMLKRRHARQLAEAEERGFKLGLERAAIKRRAEFSAQIREWNERWLAAKAKGEPFDEPPPGLDG